MANSVNAYNLLDAYNANTLWLIAQEAEIVPSKGRKPRKMDLIQLMEARFFTAARIQKSFKKLSELERTVLNRVQLRPGMVTLRSLRRELLRAEIITETPESGRYQRYSHMPGPPYALGSYLGQTNRPDSTILEDILARLTLYGLLFSQTKMGDHSGNLFKLQFHPAEKVFVPAAIRRHLPAPEPIAAQAEWTPANIVQQDPTIWLRALYLYWEYVRRHRITLLKSGLVGKRPLKALNEVLLIGDPAFEKSSTEADATKLLMLRLFLQALNLLEIKGTQLQITEKSSVTVPAFWMADQAQQLQICLGAWLLMGTTSELGDEYQYYHPDYKTARYTLIQTLYELPSESWIDFDELLETIQGKNPEFLFSDRQQVESSTRSYYYSGSYYGSPQALISNFNRAEEMFVRRVPMGLLHSLGFVELGYRRNNQKQWESVRLTERGRQVISELGESLNPLELSPATLEQTLGSLDSHEEDSTLAIPTDSSQDSGGQVIIQPNFQLLAMGPVRLGTLAQIGFFAERTRADQAAFEYQLTRESVYEAQQLGMSVVDVISFLTEISHTPLPQNVHRSLDEWSAQHERIVFRSGVNLLQAVDKEFLSELLQGEAVGEHIARTLAPEVALIKPKSKSSLIKALVAEELLPAVSGANPEAADQSIKIEENGTIQPIHAVPSLHLQGRLARFAEETNGHWAVTPTSIKQAGGSRKKVLNLIQEMGRLHRGTLPQTLIDDVKNWGGYFGNAFAETVTLIEFRDNNARNELMNHPALEGYLTPFEAGDRALAVIPSGKLTQVKNILAGFGVSVRKGVV
ncbi:helicase-associated domain-containing protein [Chloroflexi bacterium TSY]|nr:helicase-associated domain-containing protein [Chloroflexi bacterium TSY]